MRTIRTLTLVAAVLVVCSASATEKLYKWIEADGTLTFSRTPPAAGSGVNFEVIGSNQEAKSIQIGQQTQPQSNNGQSTKGIITQSKRVDHTTSQAASTSNRIAPSPTKRKSTQCGELQKRVLSLERLLRTDISPETMDNAVVQMARYQTSFNQSCNRRASN